MLAFHSPHSAAHDPVSFFRRGTTIPYPDSVERLGVLRAAALAAGVTLHEAALDADAVRAVHAPDYLDFLAGAWPRRGELAGAPEELLTTQFARPQMHRRPDGLAGLLGWYTADTSTPIREGTWRAAMGAASAAAAAARAAWTGGQAYALCRPPGHHAFGDCAGGFCFLNNTAVAAEVLAAGRTRRVAVVDIDVHHGNGTQGIFYERADVLTVSVHADPGSYFPYYAGYAEERGAGAGAGCNLNLPLAHGSGDGVFLAALDAALARVRAFAPAALVVALGLDASEHDPLGVLKVTTAGFAAAAARLRQVGCPTVLVQEGGYLCDALPVNLHAFLREFDKG